jgi:hypothetical protein
LKNALSSAPPKYHLNNDDPPNLNVSGNHTDKVEQTMVADEPCFDDNSLLDNSLPSAVPDDRQPASGRRRTAPSMANFALHERWGNLLPRLLDPLAIYLSSSMGLQVLPVDALFSQCTSVRRAISATP